MEGSLAKFGRAFIVGSSLPSFALTFAYVGAANARHKCRIFNFEAAVLLIPLLFGLVNATVNTLVSVRTSAGYTWVMVGTGLAFGLLLSSIGAGLLNLPVKLFGMSTSQRYLPLLIAPLMYAVIWGVVLNLLNRFMGIARIG